MISKAFSIRNYIMKQIMKTNKEGILQIPAKGKVDFGEMIIREDLFRKGIDPKTITSERQLDNILNTPHVSPKPKQSGEVIDVDFDKGRWKDTDPEDFAQGGRTGTGLNYLLGEDDQNSRVPFKDGHSAGRRKFLKTMAGLASIPLIGKFFKWAKPAAKVADVTSVPIKAGVDGMPTWFKPLINRVIREGEDVTKRYAYQERMVVHKTKLPESKTEVLVHQDLNTGDVWVDIGAGKHGFADGHFGQPVRLEYKAAEQIEPILPSHMDPKNPTGHWKPHKDQKTKEEFWVEEAEFTGGHPENVKFEESTFNKYGEHGSDFTEVEKFATGKNTVKSQFGSREQHLKPTKKRLRTEYESGKAEADAERWTDEADDFASGGRVPFGGGGKYMKYGQDYFTIDPEWDELDPYDWLKIEKSLLAGDYGAAEGGRVPMVFGGRTIGVLKNLLSKMKKGQGIGRGEKSLKPDILAKKLMSAEDKLKLLQLETKYADSALESLKLDRQLFKQLETNKAMKDQGLDFLMKHFVDTQTPHIKNYKSLADMDQAILELETVVKNKMLKEGRKVHATGGRVPFSTGKAVKGLAALIEKLFPGTTKVGKTSRPMSPKTELKQAIAGFQERNPTNKIISHAGDAPKAGEGRFTKAEVLIMRLKNTIKDMPDDKYVQETFPNFIKEIEANPKLANNENVWKNLGMDLPKDQQFVVYGDDTVDFFTQSKFGPHNIASKKAFHKKHPYLTEEEAIKISTMEPTDQVMELKRLETLRTTKHASGGLAGMLGE